jgi:hypothetical protein
MVLSAIKYGRPSTNQDPILTELPQLQELSEDDDFIQGVNE